MATLRGSASSYDIGNKPPTIVWTVVRGDTASFRVYVTDDQKQPLTIADWDIDMKIKRPESTPGVITDNATLILSLIPIADPDDAVGEFTVSLLSSESEILQTGDIFDIQLSNAAHVWTVAQGSMKIFEDVTD
jgi:hypothetical protein